MNHTISRLGIPARVKSRGGWYYMIYVGLIVFATAYALMARAYVNTPF